jgi:hypothetical protein
MRSCDNILNNERMVKSALVIYQIALMLFFAKYFGQYFPNQNGALGHDYAYFFPHLLDGYYWFLENGIFKIPWFSPAFCGGVPEFSNPQNMFFSIPQFLTFAVGPLFGVYITVLIFAWVGYLGTYLLLRRVFVINRLSATLAATLFLMNGFFFNRMVIGHLTFHSFMLLPLLCYFLLTPPNPERQSNMHCWTDFCFYSVITGLLWAYMFYSGMLVILVQVIFCVLAVAFIYGFLKGSLKPFFSRLVFSGMISLAICAARLIPTLAYLNNFPREQYKLPGTGFLEGIELFFRSLFLPGAWSFSLDIIHNLQWTPQLHDYDYNITPVPLVLIIMGIVFFLSKRKYKNSKEIGAIKWVYGALLIFILIIPYIFNLYSPWWHDLLKSLPLMGSSSTMIRWYVIYILPILITMAVIIERIDLLKKYSMLIFIVGLATVITLNVYKPSKFYRDQNYKPGNIIHAYYDHSEQRLHPVINKVGAFINQERKCIMTGFANDMIALGASQMLCYEPIFGYRLEKFPLGTLQPGSLTIEKNNYFNLKNPACYIYPLENNCSPGNHFSIGQKDEMLSFAAYHGYKFQVPLKQVIANWLSPIVLLLCVIYLFAHWGLAAKRKYLMVFKEKIK